MVQRLTSGWIGERDIRELISEVLMQMKVRTGIVCGMLILGGAAPARAQSNVAALATSGVSFLTSLGSIGLAYSARQQAVQLQQQQLQRSQLQNSQDAHVAELERRLERLETLPPTHITQQCRPDQRQVRVIEPNGRQKYGCED